MAWPSGRRLTRCGELEPKLQRGRTRRTRSHAVPNYDQCTSELRLSRRSTIESAGIEVVRKQAQAVPNYDQCTGELHVPAARPLFPLVRFPAVAGIVIARGKPGQEA